MEKYFLDKRFLVNGKKSHIYLDNFVSLGIVPDDGLPCQILTYTGPTYWNYGWNYLNSILTATNGLNYSSAACPNLLKLGGSLIEDTTITGSSIYKLDLLNLKELNVTSDIANLAASVSFYIQTPNVINTTAVSGQVLQLVDAGTGEVEFVTLPIPSIALDIANSIFVNENGDDVTGAPYNMYTPYRNIYTAVSAAVAGDTIIVYPGLYTHLNGEALIKEGVNLYLMEGANVVIDKVNTSTLTFNNKHGIYGNGNLTLNSNASTAINLFPFITPTTNSYITIELDNLYLNKVIINYTNYKELNINIKNITVQSTWVCPLRIRQSSATTVCNVNIGNLTGVGLNEGVISVNDLGDSSIVNINVQNVDFPFIGSANGFIFTANTNVNSTTNINVEFFKSVLPVNARNARASLTSSGGLCYGYKNISINNFITTGRLYAFQTRNGNTVERGVIKLSGKIINYTLPLIGTPISTENIIVCTKKSSAITYDLNVINESIQDSNVLLAYRQGMIQIDSENGLQKIIGYIKVSRNSSLLSPNCVVYSLANIYTSGAETGTCATLENFTIVSAGCTSIKNNTLGLDTAKIPVKNVYSNIADDTTQVDYKIQTGITVDTYVR